MSTPESFRSRNWRENTRTVKRPFARYTKLNKDILRIFADSAALTSPSIAAKKEEKRQIMERILSENFPPERTESNIK